MTNNHGMKEQHGCKAMGKRRGSDANNEGRFGRMFPKLPALYVDPELLVMLGAEDGPMDAGKAGDGESTTIPMGFIFLGQFIDHDITLDTTSSVDRANDPTATQNFRTPCLDLDCIYGDGPEATPMLYATDGKTLLTGSEDKAALAYHDLQRNRDGRAIIGDPRNDENRILSQLQLAFIRFHNAVVKKYPDQSFEDIHKTVKWHYQWIVVNDFLKVMVGSKLVRDIFANGRRFYHPSDRPFIPIEFSTAAFRFGHSLVPQQLRVKAGKNLVNLFGTALGKGFQALQSHDQVVEWDVFFAIENGNGKLQLAEQLNPKLARSLINLKDEIVGPDATPEERSLATRNLRRGQSFKLPSGESVARLMKAHGIETDISPVINRIKADTAAAGIPMGEDSTPLWYYILTEAAVLGKEGQPGEGLGPVGGRIVAEVLLGLLECDPTSYLGEAPNWLPFLAGTNEFTMADLLQISGS